MLTGFKLCYLTNDVILVLYTIKYSAVVFNQLNDNDYSDTKDIFILGFKQR